MSTREHFFSKLFNKSDQVVNKYNKINFDIYSEDERTFLKHLAWYSKHKESIKNYLTKSKSSTINKRQYIEMNQGNLTYEEFCVLEKCFEDYKEVKDYGFTIFYTSSILLYLITLYRKKDSDYARKTVLKSVLGGMGLSLSYILSYRQTEYKRIVNTYYQLLSNRMNNNPNLKFKHDENSKEAYFNLNP